MPFPNSACEISVVDALSQRGLALPQNWGPLIALQCYYQFPPEFISTGIYQLQCWLNQEASLLKNFPEHRFTDKQITELKTIYFKHGNAAEFVTKIESILWKSESSEASAPALEKQRLFLKRLVQWEELLRTLRAKFGKLSELRVSVFFLHFVSGAWSEIDVENHLSEFEDFASKPATPLK